MLGGSQPESPRWTPLFVKLLLPPRQSRGDSRLCLERSDQQADALLVTSRASYELVHKAAQCGVELLAAVSAPSAFALRLAEHAGMTLVGFARDGRFTIYSHAFRLLP